MFAQDNVTRYTAVKLLLLINKVNEINNIWCNYVFSLSVSKTRFSQRLASLHLRFCILYQESFDFCKQLVSQ
ncbi:Hypothetical protein CINCED_3A013493 [Cinara cedri]|uniref:Uncharacterized protein n=1 Tax=Cinara cedri TaxID=506608 RepID=A0A5E4MVF1_9HEMI|nr:Hypothetical protein CINCED_3A013493 [Cinara cedri]